MCCVAPPSDYKDRPDPSMDEKVRLYMAALILPALLVAVAFLVHAALVPSSRASASNARPFGATQQAVAPATPTMVAPTPTPLARLSVSSHPAGALVLVNGTEKGRTPLLLEDLDAGSHHVKLSLSTEQSWQEEVDLNPGETRQLDITLPAPPTPTPTPEPIPAGPVYPLAVMVENHFDARPQSGLARADIVYEALVEGGITRFMAIFLDGKSDVVGPVRSARHYFVYLAAEFNASYVHIGASPQGYGAINATEITRLDETYGDPGFWRSRARYAPHNAYTSTDLARTNLDKFRKVTPGSTAGFKFLKDGAAAQGAEGKQLSLGYPGGYQVKYVYAPEDKRYLRFMEGLPHRDAETGEQISPRNLIVQYVDAWPIAGDTSGRLDMEQVGEGKALFFRDGVVTQGFWHKPSYGNITEWFDSDWKPLMMNPGKTWVQIIPPTGKVSY